MDRLHRGRHYRVGADRWILEHSKSVTGGLSMLVDDALNSDFFQQLVEAVMKDVANVVMPGNSVASVLALHGGKALWRLLQDKSVTEQQNCLTEVSNIPNHSARQIAQIWAEKFNFDSAEQGEIVNYLSAIPMTTRHALSRPNDHGHITALLSQVPRTESEVFRYVPIRTPRFQPGEKIPLYDYEIEALLGQGGFAEVWKARHTEQKNKPPVALKFCLDPKLLPSLKTEIKLLDAMGQTGEKDFVKLLGTAYSADPPFLIYEYIDGGDLFAWLAAFDGKRPKEKQVVDILVMTARAVAEAHEKNIVHRDLKPANLLVTRKGRIKVADFGIGALLAASETSAPGLAEITNATVLRNAHTPLYSDSSSAVTNRMDPKVDVYAMGVIAYQLLCGDLTRAIGPAWKQELKDIGVSNPLLKAIGACVAVPKKRFNNAGALLAALESLDDSSVAEKVKRNYHRDTIKSRVKSRTKPQSKSSKPSPEGSQQHMKHCIQCGVRISPIDRFCMNCGHLLT